MAGIEPAYSKNPILDADIRVNDLNQKLQDGDIPVPGGSGDVTNAANLGAGAPLFVSKLLGILGFKTLVAGANISLNESAEEIEIEAAGGGGGGLVDDAENLGAGEGVFAQLSAAILQFKSLVAGSGIDISADADEITIAATGGGGGGDYTLAVNTTPGTVTLGAGDYGKFMVALLAATTYELPATAPEGTRFLIAGIGAAASVTVPADTIVLGFQVPPGAAETFELPPTTIEFVALTGTGPFAGKQLWVPRFDATLTAYSATARYIPGMQVSAPSFMGSDEIFEAIGGGSPPIEGLVPRDNPNRWRQLSGLAEYEGGAAFDITAGTTPLQLIDNSPSGTPAGTGMPNGQKCRVKQLVLDWSGGDATGVGTVTIREKGGGATLFTIAEADLGAAKKFILGNPEIVYVGDTAAQDTGIEIVSSGNGVSGTIIASVRVDFIF